MATSTNLLAATEENRRQADDRFMSHCSSARVDSNVATLSLIRSAYGDYHVTEVDAREVALLEYAAADNAAVVFDGEDTSFHAMRTWHPVGEGVAKKMHPGKLDDAFRFARYVAVRL
jgi:transitional endoplasmic reticulum ATPase